jgi:hypothetical protein
MVFNLTSPDARRRLHLCVTVCLAMWGVEALPAQVSVLTWHNDNARSGQNLQETILTPANVNQSTFGRLFTIAVDGKVDAQPLYVPALTIPSKGVHNVLFVVTENDSAYAFDADTGTQLWHMSTLGTNETPSDDRGCSQVMPTIGITGTPVIDLGMGPHGTMYLIAMTVDSGTYRHRIHALDITTGAEQFGGPVVISATFPGTGAEGSGGVQTFAASQHKERPGLLISNGVVYTTWGSHCDAGPYTGWVIGYNESTLAQTSVLNLTPNGSDGGIWMAGAGPAADSAGNLYLLMGNGTFDTTLSGGLPDQGDYGNSFVKIQVAQNGTLSVADYFTMSNTTSESNGDVDLGSGGLMLLPPVTDSNQVTRSLAVGAGKDRNVYVVDRAHMMGEFSANGDNIFQQLTSGVGGGVFSSPAWFNGVMYYGASGDVLRSFSFTDGQFVANPVTSSHSYPSPGATPAISANGTFNAVLWVAENTSPAVLHAYAPTNLGTELYDSNQAASGRDQFGTGNKFIVPTVANGKVYVGTTSGVGVFGLLCGFSLTSTHASYPVSGGSGQISVPASSTCSWTAASDATWLTVTSGSSGTGTGTVGYSVAANTGSDLRSATITVGGQTFVVTEAGTSAVSTVSKAGIFRSGFLWLLDVDGNEQWDSPPDVDYAFGGIPGDIPITGDWNGDGRTKIGIYRPKNGLFILDSNGNGVFDTGDAVYKFMANAGGPQAGDVPVVGDWNGSGTSKIGIVRDGFLWLLDLNGDGTYEPGTDLEYAYGGVPGDIPVVGDWTGTGTSKIGVLRDGYLWILNASGTGSYQAGQDLVFPFGAPGDVPVVGDWTGDGISKVGMFRAGFLWVLDSDDPSVTASIGLAPLTVFAFGGVAGDVPVVGKW